MFAGDFCRSYGSPLAICWGGIATISQRYASANNPLVDGYHDDQPSVTWLIWMRIVCAPLPRASRSLSAVSNFDASGNTNLRPDSIKADAEIGYIIECDLTYSAHLHDEYIVYTRTQSTHSCVYNDYPLVAEHLTVTRQMLSPFAESLLDLTRAWKPSKKLVPNLLHKLNYVCRYRKFQLYVRHGLVITNIHRILSFTQRAWLKPWIDH